MRHAILGAVLSAALLTGCGKDDDAMTTSSAAGDAKTTDTIRIVDFVYDPTPAIVRAGDTISVANADAAPHTLTDAAPSATAFDSGTIQGRATGSLTIDKPGTYDYVCELHPFMKGEITVRR